jgi:hypothetical protein
MKRIKIKKEWSKGVWNNIFKADNIKTFNIKDNCLLDDFCDYCGYTIQEQIDDSNIIISGPINLLGADLYIRLSITNERNKFIAKYQVVSIPFVSLVVTFREEAGNLIVEDDLRGANLVTRVLYRPIADRFVSDGAYAIEQFMNDI